MRVTPGPPRLPLPALYFARARVVRTTWQTDLLASPITTQKSCPGLAICEFMIYYFNLSFIIRPGLASSLAFRSLRPKLVHATLPLPTSMPTGKMSSKFSSRLFTAFVISFAMLVTECIVFGTILGTPLSSFETPWTPILSLLQFTVRKSPSVCCSSPASWLLTHPATSPSAHDLSPFLAITQRVGPRPSRSTRWVASVGSLF